MSDNLTADELKEMGISYKVKPLNEKEKKMIDEYIKLEIQIRNKPRYIFFKI